MFGIGKIKEMTDRIDSLTRKVGELFNREHSNRATVAYIKSDILKLSGQFGEFKENMNPVSAQRADELAVAIAKCSADMAELDRRLCSLENAQMFTMAYRHNDDAPALSDRDKAFSPNAVLVSREPIQAARPTPEHLNGDPAQQPLELSRKKKYVQRVESAAVARTIVSIDKDAARIVEGLKRRNIHQRIIDACIAAGVVDATRNKRDVVVREKRRHGNRRYYNASVRCYGDHSRDIGFPTAREANHCMREMQSVVRYVAEYFDTGMVFDEGKPTGGKP